ncbi:MAG: adenylate/guanylate cyclase domain-containing protein [Candidatus Aminicenantes bacterium]|nr:adenylate/guanylate cyclase domain-containing protein [Candidatus Aminicenantes bacterium]
MKRFLASTALIFACTFVLGNLVSSLFEKKVYDQKVRFFSRPCSAAVILVEIDQESIDFYNLNFQTPWPWPRSYYARAIDFLTAAGARAVAIDMIFSEPSLYGGEDEWLAASMKKSGRAFMPLFFLGQQGPAEDLDRFVLATVPALSRLPVREGKVLQPLPRLRAALRGAGNAQAAPDRDRIYRRLQHFVVHGGRVYPSFSLALALFADPRLSLAEIPFAADGGLNLKFYHPKSFRRHSISELIQSQVRLEAGETPILDAAVFKDKIVVIGATAQALLDNRSTPVNAIGSGFELHATALSNLLERDFMRVFDPRLQWLLVMAAILLLNFFLSRIKAIQMQLLAALGVVLLALAGNLLLFFSGLDLDFIPLFIGLVTCSGYDAYNRYQRVRREKKFIQNAFKNYLSDSLLAEIIKNPRGLNLGGERKLVTIFFSDLAGFTTLAEALSPEAVVNILNIYLERMTSVIMENGGFVNKFAGDAVMAFWGAPLASEDQAIQAMGAARRCQEELSELNLDFEKKGLPQLGMRIGINSGEVIVGNIGSRKRFEYTVIGDAVNLASRLEGINKQYKTAVICGSMSAGMAAERMVLRQLDRVRVKGKKIPEEIYEVVGEKSRAAAAEVGGLARFDKGLQLYFSGDFAAALEIFTAAPDDPPAQVFVQRCQYLLDNPPDSWDGVWTFTEK